MKWLDQRDLMIKELIEGIETTKELRNQIIRGSNQASSDDQALINHSLIDKMLSTFDKTISWAKKMGCHQQPITTTTGNNNNNNNSSNQLESDSPPSLALRNPRSEDSHQNHHVSKKRKMMPRWTKTVQVCPGGKISGLEGPLDDGYSWRKYGQKDILRAKYPRGYYRCTHQPTQKCFAKKQVQQSDDDPSIYQIIYHGEHTCFQGAQTRPSPTQIKTEPPTPPPPSLPTNPPQQNHIAQSPPPPPPPPPQDEIYLGLGPNGELKVEPEENIKEAQIFRSFSFTFAGLVESGPTDNYNLSCLPAFGSPTTSESNHFSVSPYEPIASPGSGLNIQTSDSDLYEAISGPNSVANSPIFDDFEFPLEQLLDICELPEF